MADVKITGLTANATALDGTELFEIVNADTKSRKETLSNISTYAAAQAPQGTVTKVDGKGTVNGITLTGSVTAAGDLTLGGTLGSVDLTTQITGTLPIGNGGTGQTTKAPAFDALAPTTTQGDIIVRGAADNERLAIGTKDFVLTSNGTTAVWAAATGGGTPGGADTQVQFNDGGAFGGDSGLTFDKTNNALTVGGATVTTNNPVLNLSQTWNAGAVTFTGIKLNVTDTTSAAASLLIDFQVGGTSIIKATKVGALTVKSTSGAAKMELVAADSSTVTFTQSGTLAICNGAFAASGKLQGEFLELDYANGGCRLYRVSANVMGVRAAASTTGGAFNFLEQTAPSAPSANQVTLYAEDNGAGKTRLMALFATGAAQQVAIEP